MLNKLHRIWHKGSMLPVQIKRGMGSKISALIQCSSRKMRIEDTLAALCFLSLDFINQHQSHNNIAKQNVKPLLQWEVKTGNR